jgi:UDP-GlcNAc3NAcA epimerase
MTGGVQVTEVTGSKNNSSAVTWMSIVGARPQFVKLGPVCRAIEAHNNLGHGPRIDHIIVHTGQHYDHEVSGLLFSQLGLPDPDYKLAVGSSSPGVQLARMLARMERVLSTEKPDWVVVYGDTNSTLAGALLAARLKLPLAHVEAGCRSLDPSMPEEQNRIVTDHLSALLLATSAGGLENLRREGIGSPDDVRKRRAVVVGDVMYDALVQNLPLAEQFAGGALHDFGFERGNYYLLTIHRAENTNAPERLRNILEAASSLTLPVLFPVHPRTKQALASAGISVNGSVHCVPPLGYFEMLALAKDARKIITDSGGVQKEAFYLGVPCVTLREQTEWPETVDLGANRLGGTSPQSIRDAVCEAQDSDWSCATPYGDGRAAQKIVNELLLAAGYPAHNVVAAATEA